MESERYSTMLREFIELGGSRNLLLSSTDIEVKVVDMGLEDNMYMDESREVDIRRRRKLIARTKRRRNSKHDQKSDGSADSGPSDPSTIDELYNQAEQARGRVREDTEHQEEESPSPVHQHMMQPAVWDSQSTARIGPVIQNGHTFVRSSAMMGQRHLGSGL